MEPGWACPDPQPWFSWGWFLRCLCWLRSLPRSWFGCAPSGLASPCGWPEAGSLPAVCCYWAGPRERAEAELLSSDCPPAKFDAIDSKMLAKALHADSVLLIRGPLDVCSSLGLRGVFRASTSLSRACRRAQHERVFPKSKHMRLARSRTEIPPRFALPPFFKGGKGGIYSPSVMKCTNVVWSDLE